MDNVSLILLALGSVTILSSLGVLLSRDNFYSALYMALTMIFIATMFTVFNIQSAFILIAFIFIGAVGIVTVALAAVFRYVPRKVPVDKLWIIPTILTIAVLAYTLYKYATFNLSAASSVDIAAFQSQYALAVVFLICLMVLLMISIVKMVRREEVCLK